MANKILVRNDAAEITWKSSGGTVLLTLTSLATNAAREGGKADLGVVHAARYAVRFDWDMTTAAVAGAIIELWWSSSKSATAATDNTGGTGVTGADAAWAPTGGVDDNKPQLLFIGAAVCSDTTNTIRQRAEFVFFPTQRWGSIIVVNKTTQSLGSTAGNLFVTFTPLEDEIQ